MGRSDGIPSWLPSEDHQLCSRLSLYHLQGTVLRRFMKDLKSPLHGLALNERSKHLGAVAMCVFSVDAKRGRLASSCVSLLTGDAKAGRQSRELLQNRWNPRVGLQHAA